MGQVIAPARKAAFQILLRVNDGGYASDLLLSNTAAFDSRDAGLAAEIVFGVLRRQLQLDWLIQTLTSKPVARLDPEVAISLRMGLYQLRHLERVPDHAIVSESVELVKLAGKRSAAGLVNAVLRRAPQSISDWPSRSVALSTPEWLLGSWDKQFGATVSTRIAEEFLKKPSLYLRAPDVEPGDLVVEKTDVPGAYRLISGSRAGLRLQDISAQTIVPLLELTPGHRFLDVCAAPGNKTAQALELPLQAVACDRHWRRLEKMSGCSRVVLDATQPLPFRSRFDRILVDVPCSGTGTLGRNPEIRWRLLPKDLQELKAKQKKILTNSLEMLQPGGRLVYSTCSLENAENEEVVHEVAQSSSGFRLERTLRRTPGIEEGDGFFAAVWSRQFGEKPDK